MKSVSRTKIFMFTLVAQIFTLLVLLLLMEGIFRFINQDYDLRGRNERSFFCVFDSVLGWIPKKNFVGIHEKDGFSIPVHQNQFGLRASQNLVRENPGGKHRIIVLGDSYVWGYGVSDNEVFTELDISRYGAELVNFGVSGYGTDQEYLLYKKLGKEFEADEVILVITPYNDFMNNSEARQYGYDKPYFMLVDDQLMLHTKHIKHGLLKGFKSWLSENSFIFNFVGSLIRNVKQSLESRKKSASAPKQAILQRNSVTDSDRSAIDLTIRIVDKLKNLVESQGRKFKVAFVPYKIHINQNISYNHPMVPIFADKLKEKEINYLEPFFLFSHPDGKKAELFNQGDNHFSALGHELFVRALLEPEMVRQVQNYYHEEGSAGKL